jgi:hypothetical protein
MSRATPEKRKVWSARSGSWPAGLRPSPPLAHRDHGPDGPDGPDGRRRPRSTAPPGVSSLGSRVSALHRRRRDHLAATVPTRRRDPRGPRRTPNRRSTRSVRPGDPRLRELGFEAVTASTGGGPRALLFQPVVCRDRPLAPWSALVTTVVPGEPLGRPSTPTLTMPSACVGRSGGIIVGVLALCFRFPFDQ